MLEAVFFTTCADNSGESTFTTGASGRVSAGGRTFASKREKNTRVELNARLKTDGDHFLADHSPETIASSASVNFVSVPA